MAAAPETMASDDGERAVATERSRRRWSDAACIAAIAAAAALLFVFGSRDFALTEPDEARYAEIAREMLVRHDWVKPGALVIDVGINKIPDATKKSGSRLVGDVAFDEVKEVAGALTPVPGGVGPMTIAMLLQNTLRGAELADGA